MSTLLIDKKISPKFLVNRFEYFMLFPCMKELNLSKEIEQRMWEHLTYGGYVDNQLREIGRSDISHLLQENPPDLEVARAIYLLLANCVGTDSNGELLECSADFMVQTG